METKIMKSINQVIRRGSGERKFLFRYAAMVIVLLTLGIGNAWAGHGGKCTAKLQVNTGTGSGSVYAAATSSATSGSSSVSADCGDSDNGTHTRTFYAFATPADGYTFLGWTESATSTAGADASNPKAVTITSESHSTVTKTLYAHFVEKAKVNITFEAPSNGTYTIKVNGGSTETISSSNVVKNGVMEVTLTATPASGYAFAGWYKLNSSGEFVEDISIASPYDASFTASETIKMGARFVPTTLGKFILKGSSTEYYGLKAATVAAGGSGTIVPVADETLVDGSDLMPFDNGTYSIKAGATLLVPYSSANTVQTAPVKINTTASATAISSYRKLILSDGVNIDCDGTICVGGQADAGGGGNPSGYVTGACGVIDMSKGGHIEMNNKAILYCWGFIKGQDMDQGNNTVGAGTITANSGSVIWEDFSVGDWRGGTATSNFSGRFFPFQSYYIQNIEVPVTYKYGSTLKNFFTFNMSSSAQETTFDVIGSNTALFKLTDAQSLVRKWYDPTTDLVCYEVSGTAVLDYISLEVYITINSYDYDLPISSNMHIILTKCNLTLNRPMLVQPGGIIEIKNDANVTLATKIYMYDKDEWGPWISGKYYRSYGDAYPILTSHKNRGDGSSNADLDDATFLVDGTLTISSGAGLYSSTGGANIMGNGGGKVVFSSSLPSATSVKWYKGTKTSGDGEVGTTAMKAANLCNEDGSYTKSIASTTFHNVNGRWFTASAKNEKADHTYDFTYISSGEVSGTGGTSSTTDAVYSNDKTGMEARMKWANVTADACADWWHGQGTQAGWFYNWTMNSAWHQFQSTETEGLYSGSNNKIYTKTDCNWEELGETDVNCLYTIDGKKKALVDGHFIELEPNSDDAAFHEAADATKYYICFEGCNWHEATKIEGEKKAYAINEDNFIWYEDRWMQAEREIPFFYTYDETNVKVYYEYIGSEWVLAQPYVEVTDAIETRQLLRFNEAITVASGKKNATITLLRDLVNITTPMTFTGANTTCTLDLNGHVAEVHVVGAGTSEIKMLTLNGASTTFTITDNTTDKKGELKLIASVNTETSTKRWSGIYVQNGSLVLQSGKVYVEHPFAWVSNSNTGFIRGILVASAKTFTMNGGTLEVVSDYNTYGIESASGTPTVNINHGTIECIATKKDSPYGIIGYGTINIKNDSYIHANAKASSSSRGVSVSAGSSYQGTVNVTGGTIYSEATSSAQGIYCGGTAVVTGDYNATTPNNTPKNRYYAKANISGGTITAVCRTSTSSYGVLSYGTTTISGGTITSTVQKSNQNTAYGVCANGGTTTIKTGANITANAPANAYGLCSSAANGSSAQGWAHVGDLKVEGGTITANTTNGTTAYGLLVTGTTYTISRTDGYKVFNGDYAAAGTATVTGGTFYANAKTTLARGIAVAATKTKNEASATPKCTINGGYYKMTGTGDLLGCNASALAADFHINGGYYSHNGNLATYAASPKHVLTLASGDANRPPYYYKVAEAYQVTFKTEDGTANIIDPIYQEVNTKPVCSTEPTKASTSTNSFTFDGWATAANGNKVYEPNGLPNVTSAGATYYAHFATTTLKYRVHLDATENGGECATENIYVEPGTAVGTLPTATKYGYTFSGWFTAASGGTKLEATTVINANADYYAQFTVNSHTLTWDLAGGAVGTAGKIGSTTWPAKNATGTQSRSVAYGTVLTTIPVVTKTGYVFNRWDPVPTSSMPDNDVTYTALWNPATNTKYYVKHYQQNIDDDNYTLVETDELTGTTDATVTPDRKSYDGFLTPTPQQLTIGAAGTSELVYNYDRVVYTINWNASANGGTCATASTDVRHGATIALPAATKAGHILEGWYTKAEGGNKISDGAAVLQNYGTLYAQFIEVPTYKLTWDWNGGETSSTSYTAAGNLLAGDPIVYPEDNTMTRAGYTFTGWDKSNSTMPDADLTITASWTPNTNTAYTVKHYKQKLDGTYASTPDETDNLTGTTATEVTPAVKNYTGFDAPSTQTVTILANGSRVVTYNYTRKSYDLSWVTDGDALTGDFTHGSTKFGAAIIAPNTPTKTGYTFASWSPAKAETMPAAATEYTATWTVKQYTLTVAANDAAMGTVSGGGLYDYNSAHTITATPKSGFKFVEWNDHNTNASREVTVTADVTYTATFDYDIANYTVKHWQQNIYDDDYTEVVADRQTDLSGTIGAQTNAEAKNYTGFTLKSPIAQQTIALENTVVNIYYNRATYTISWIVKLSGEIVASKEETLKYGATPSFGPDPTKEQDERWVYSFSGWTPNIAEVTANQTYEGTFNAIARTYDVTWNNADGTLIQKEENGYTWGAQPSFPGSSNPTYSDGTSKVYEFRGWKYERTGDEYKKDVVLPGVAGDETYTALYTCKEGPIVVANGKTDTISTNTETDSTTVHVGGTLYVAAGQTLTTTNLILEATGEESGQIMETGTIEADNVYFDLTLNTLRRHWRAFTVPFEVNLKQHPILADGVSMPLGVHYDIVYYDGAERAAHGKTPDCWRYVEDDENWILTPGRAYMIVFGRDVNTVRFTKKDGASIQYSGEVSVAANNGASDAVNGGWNGIGNPATYHALLNAGDGVTTCQVHNGEEIGSDGYIPCDMGKFIVGKAVFVQVAAEQTVVVNKADSDDPQIAAAPRRAKANATGKNRFDVQIAPVDGQMADRMFLHADEYKEDKYVILQDLAKAGLSTKRAQMWVERYDTKLCKNTALLFNGVAEFPLGIFAPQAGEYEISVAESPDEESTLYLTLDGVPVWNLSYGPYTAKLENGTTTRYGLKWVRNYVPAISTSVDNTQADKQPTAQKILLNDKVYILRGENVYSADGQLVK